MNEEIYILWSNVEGISKTTLPYAESFREDTPIEGYLSKAVSNVFVVEC